MFPVDALHAGLQPFGAGDAHQFTRVRLAVLAIKMGKALETPVELPMPRHRGQRPQSAILARGAFGFACSPWLDALGVTKPLPDRFFSWCYRSWLSQGKGSLGVGGSDQGDGMGRGADSALAAGGAGPALRRGRDGGCGRMAAWAVDFG